MQLFYSPSVDRRFTLDEQESRHAIKVLRKQVGDTLQVVDGKGNFMRCRITNASPKNCEVERQETVALWNTLPYSLHVAIAPTKSIDRTEWFLEKATEIGVTKVTFLKTFHGERQHLKIERLQKIVISAMKQSLKATLPLLQGLVPFEQFVSEASEPVKALAYVDAENPTQWSELTPLSGDKLILIGPEGDFSTQEVEAAERYGFKKVGLGPSRLRTETAGIAAVHTLYLNHASTTT